jgi:hypothetical protein
MDCTTFTLLYTALVKLRLEYANQVWCPYLKKNIESIENVKEDRDRTVGPQCRNLHIIHVKQLFSKHDHLITLQLTTI